VQPRKPPREDLEHVGDHCAALRGDDADPRRKPRQRTLPRLLEQPLGGQLLLELLEGELQRAVPLQLQRLHLQLILAARFIHVDAAARQHRRAILRFELEVARGGAEADAAQLRFGVLQREIVVPAGSQLRAGDLTRHPDIGELAVQQAANEEIQFRYREDAPLRAELQDELFHGDIRYYPACRINNAIVASGLRNSSGTWSRRQEMGNRSSKTMAFNG